MTVFTLQKAGVAGLLLSMALVHTANAGVFFKKEKCPACQANSPDQEKSKKAKEPPRGPVVFSVGGIVEPGPAVVPAVQPRQPGLTDEGATGEETEQMRIDKMERDIQELKVMMARLSAVVEKLANP